MYIITVIGEWHIKAKHPTEKRLMDIGVGPTTLGVALTLVALSSRRAERAQTHAHAPLAILFNKT